MAGNKSHRELDREFAEMLKAMTFDERVAMLVKAAKMHGPKSYLQRKKEREQQRKLKMNEDKKTVRLEILVADLHWVRLAVQDGAVRGSEERMTRERVFRLIEAALNIKGVNQPES